MPQASTIKLPINDCVSMLVSVICCIDNEDERINVGALHAGQHLPLRSLEAIVVMSG
jgi:hypothetical protein